MLDSMSYIPLFFDVTARPCAVLGGDELAERRVSTLLEAGAIVTVISAELTAGLAELVARGRIRLIPRCFVAGDLCGVALAYCYSTDLSVARAAADEARSLGVPMNVADRPALCSFVAPAVVKRGTLQIAISTGGASPALAKIIREELAASFGAEYGLLLKILAAARKLMRNRERGPAQRAELARDLARELRIAIKAGDEPAVDDILVRRLGTTLAGLKLELNSPDPMAVGNLPRAGGAQ
jgi:precorrin-2 dehydrogenase/sirohydrochlorin ferrochelatase